MLLSRYNLVNRNQIWIVITLFRLVLNQSEKCNYVCNLEPNGIPFDAKLF